MNSLDKYNFKNEQINIYELEYSELIGFLNKSNYILLIGATWCKNCIALVPFLNSILVSNNVKCFYFDVSNGESRENDIRKNPSYNDTLASIYFELQTIHIPTIFFVKDKIIKKVTLEYIEVNNRLVDENTNIDVTKEVHSDLTQLIKTYC